MKTLAVKSALALVPLWLLYAGPPAHATETKPQAPTTQTSPGQQPSLTVRELAGRAAPALTGQGDAAKKNALAFIDWAAASTKDQDDVVLRALAGARDNADIVAAFCDEAFAVQESDHSRALITLALIGETKSRAGMECLTKFLAQPFPERGTLVDGEILEQRALGMLQAKAIDGLAYLHDERADQTVLNAAGKHPSRIVRAEAIAAYLWNHDYDARSRETLKAAVRSDEAIFLERLVKQATLPKEAFNRQLAAYLKAHPDLVPPRPEKARIKPDTTVGQPPNF